MTQAQNHIVPPGSKVLVTGANGYIASHIIKVLLDLGYLVQGTVRTPMPWLTEYFEKRYGSGRFELIVVSDFQQSDAFDESVKGVSGVIHVAQGLPSSTAAETVESATAYTVNGVVNLLKAASTKPTIKRVVLTSSIVAAGYPAGKGFKLDVDTWDKSLEQASKGGTTVPIYRACKVEGERQAWKWVEKNQPHFELNTVLPWLTLGKILHPNIGGSTMGYVSGLLKGDTTPFKFLPLPWFVDVEDTARLHAIALISPSVRSERLFAAATPFIWGDVIEILKRIQPNNARIPAAPVKEEPTIGDIVPAARAEKLLRETFGQRGWTPLEVSLEGGIARE
ncbi:hypothetical protein E8E15_006409 [Penicillium rubens]|uniref:Ketoreductase adrE n=2 Tax=Penicillium chrysogenum species complex TaxID=254878 RepID=ADRE_PENRW|nr:uncharacterized protein N7525_004101 [Penicillium rubens]B6HV33.1 RecName: Full=Ketoreductase adrE; AltName: Full=Andrastin A biosynthesis cluster protein E [Penicillium rubens Wisconsin 54-1255]KZN90421.1 Aldehyde reductase [Penicillium chrysogenum]KAF3018011.1 hypothetical protein E8E15_006409 [Penicillium rubens]KAJ5045093.1 hypothetical protein NUH16_001905 [Penicillium rubens]KAJ5838913.1 hypothetical protein N7525_004101 [Penicillium rubens]KAJ5866963.1 hypothetical protein N7534_001